MRKFQFFLAYYTLITSIIIFVWSIFVAPKPLGFIIAILFIPSSIYFWLLILGVSKLKPDKSKEDVKKQDASMAKFSLVILIALFVSASSIFVYSLIQTQILGIDTSVDKINKLSDLDKEVNKINEKNNNTDDLKDEIEKLDEEISNLKESDAAKDPDFKTVIGETDNQIGSVTIDNSEYKTVNIYDVKSSSGKVIAKAEFGVPYTFVEKDDNWYLIVFSEDELIGELNANSSLEGYVSSQFVNEIEL